MHFWMVSEKSKLGATGIFFFSPLKSLSFHLLDIVQEFKTSPGTQRGQSGLNTTVPSSDL